jgi:hypothetical protein
MRLLVVPNYLREQIYAAIDREIERVPEAAPDREYFYKQVLGYFDEHGVVPAFSLIATTTLSERVDP